MALHRRAHPRTLSTCSSSPSSCTSSASLSRLFTPRSNWTLQDKPGLLDTTTRETHSPKHNDMPPRIPESPPSSPLPVSFRKLGGGSGDDHRGPCRQPSSKTTGDRPTNDRSRHHNDEATLETEEHVPTVGVTRLRDDERRHDSGNGGPSKKPATSDANTRPRFSLSTSIHSRPPADPHMLSASVKEQRNSSIGLGLHSEPSKISSTSKLTKSRSPASFTTTTMSTTRRVVSTVINVSQRGDLNRRKESTITTTVVAAKGLTCKSDRSARHRLKSPSATPGPSAKACPRLGTETLSDNRTAVRATSRRTEALVGPTNVDLSLNHVSLMEARASGMDIPLLPAIKMSKTNRNRPQKQHDHATDKTVLSKSCDATPFFDLAREAWERDTINIDTQSCQTEAGLLTVATSIKHPSTAASVSDTSNADKRCTDDNCDDLAVTLEGLNIQHPLLSAIEGQSLSDQDQVNRTMAISTRGSKSHTPQSTLSLAHAYGQSVASRVHIGVETVATASCSEGMEGTHAALPRSLRAAATHSDKDAEFSFLVPATSISKARIPDAAPLLGHAVGAGFETEQAVEVSQRTGSRRTSILTVLGSSLAKTPLRDVRNPAVLFALMNSMKQQRDLRRHQSSTALEAISDHAYDEGLKGQSSGTLNNSATTFSGRGVSFQEEAMFLKVQHMRRENAEQNRDRTGIVDVVGSSYRGNVDSYCAYLPSSSPYPTPKLVLPSMPQHTDPLSEGKLQTHQFSTTDISPLLPPTITVPSMVAIPPTSRSLSASSSMTSISSTDSLSSSSTATTCSTSPSMSYLSSAPLRSSFLERSFKSRSPSPIFSLTPRSLSTVPSEIISHNAVSSSTLPVPQSSAYKPALLDSYGVVAIESQTDLQQDQHQHQHQHFQHQTQKIHLTSVRGLHKKDENDSNCILVTSALDSGSLPTATSCAQESPKPTAATGLRHSPDAPSSRRGYGLSGMLDGSFRPYFELHQSQEPDQHRGMGVRNHDVSTLTKRLANLQLMDSLCPPVQMPMDAAWASQILQLLVHLADHTDLEEKKRLPSLSSNGSSAGAGHTYSTTDMGTPRGLYEQVLTDWVRRLDQMSENVYRDHPGLKREVDKIRWQHSLVKGTQARVH